MRALAIIPARSGSKGLKDKNILDVFGKPLMDYTITAACESGCFEKIMVSTDSERYASIARKCGAEVPFLRSETTSTDSSSTWDVVKEVLKGYSLLGENFDYVAVLQPTSPLRSSEDIKGTFDMLRSEGVRNVVTVTETSHPIQWCFPLDERKSMKEYAASPFSTMRRQMLEKHYQENGAIYLVDAHKILDDKYNFYSDDCYAYIMPQERSIDIDEEIDLIVLKAILQNELCKGEI